MKKYRLEIRLMGSQFELIIVASNEAAGNRLLSESVAEIRRIEALLTEFDAASQTAQINAQAGIAPVPVDAEVYALTQRSIRLSALTQGAFDITAGALKQLYPFKRESITKLPGAAAIAQVMQAVGYNKIQLLPPDKIYLQYRDMHIGFGGIGKGYAADKVKAMLLKKGVTSGVINASGDLTAWGLQPNNSPWKIGIAHPDNTDATLCWLPVNGTAVATSGNYEQYFDIDGIRYSHNLDPRTGMPAKYIKSVTIISVSAELSDALATAVTIMGKDAGMHLVNQLPDVHCILIDGNNGVFTSKKIDLAR